MTSHLWTVLDCSLAVVGIVLIRQLFKRSSLPLPPGPSGWPLIGNLLDAPTTHQWFKFAEFGEKYGDMVYLNLVGQPMVIVNSMQLAVEMLDRKSAIYSDRPTLPLGGEIVGWKYSLGLVRYGDRFREIRRFFHRFMGSKSQVEQFLPLQELEAQRFLKRVSANPDDVGAHIRKTVGKVIMKMSHGYDVQEGPDPLVNLVETTTDQFSQLSAPGAYIVDVFPILIHLPSWFPGAGFKKQIPFWQKSLADTTDLPFEFVRSRMRDHTNTPNFVSELLENEDLNDDKLFNIKWAASALYAAGADTTVSALYTFFLAMTLFPDAQRRAQEEIDAVIGNDRLPTFADRAHLPYIEALVTEVLRWQPVAPLGVPHRVIQDDVHNGYLIPKGTVVVANIWKILHDPKDYPDPFTFEPARFLAAAGKELPLDPRKACFGFGRRICPGAHIADGSVFISCAMTLAVFSISKAVENGQVITPKIQYTTGTISHPEPFKCSIKPRSAKAEALLQSLDELH